MATVGGGCLSSELGELVARLPCLLVLFDERLRRLQLSDVILHRRQLGRDLLRHQPIPATCNTHSSLFSYFAQGRIREQHPLSSPPLLLRSRVSLQLGGLGERCKLPQWGSGRSNVCKRIWCCFASSALMLLVGRQEGHLACKKWVVRCWHGYLSAARCRLAYGPADATATHCLLLQ